ncbi:MAG TPA: type II secretion system F family protein [Gammaproteobacteria bacterium]|nr:type II secretion system F family protein [Gammaproteobacteria bacterium]
MPYYFYKGRNKQGQNIEGVLEASNEHIVFVQLGRLEIIPVSIQKTTKPLYVQDLSRYLPFLRPKLTELAIFAKQMYSLLKANVPVNHALQVVIESNKNAILNNALTNIILDLESGFSLARCFQKQGFLFPPFISAMIDIGENTGQLEEAFHQIHHYLEADILTRKRIKSAFRYPLIVLVAIIFALSVINFLVVPAFQRFFESLDAQLPFATRWLIEISRFSLTYWPLLVLALAVFIGVYFFIMNQPAYRYYWDKVKLQIPLVGSIIHRSILARFTRSLSAAHSHGLPLLDAIQVVAKSTDNLYITDKILQMRTGLERGETLAITAKNTKVFSSLVIQMIIVGEETGNIDANLMEIAEFYESDVDYDIKRLSDALEPVLVAIIAGVVLILALGVFLPLWDLSSVAMHKIRGG